MRIIYCLLISITFLSIAKGQSSFYSYTDAVMDANETKPIIMVFSGSDWCKPCIQLKKDILESKEFLKFKDEIVFLYLDFPFSKKNRLSKEQTIHNESLAEKYNQEGAFPKIVLLNHKEELLATVNYSKKTTAASFIHEIKSSQ